MIEERAVQLLAIEYAGYKLLQVPHNTTDDEKIELLCCAYEDALHKIKSHVTRMQPEPIVRAF